MIPPRPRTFGAYVLHHSLAAGGMGEVFLATRIGAPRGTPPLVLKILLPECASDPVFVNMFHDESRIGLRLSHPNVMGVYDLGRVGDDHFLVMEYVHGVDLRQLQARLREAREKLPLETVLSIGLESLQGLDHAHRAKDEKGRPLNLVHRDLSPENIMVGFDGDVKILDFGIAKADGRAAVTRAGTVKGKTGYMSPEQARGEKVDCRTDLYALALVMLELISGKRRFPPDTDKFDEIRMARSYVPPAPSEFDRSIPASVDEVFMKALELDKENRHQTADEFTQELNRALREYKATRRERAEWLPMLLLRHFPDRAEPFLIEPPSAPEEASWIEDATTAGYLAHAKEGKVVPKPIVRTEGRSLSEADTLTIDRRKPPPVQDERTLRVAMPEPAAQPAPDRPSRVRAVTRERPPASREEPSAPGAGRVVLVVAVAVVACVAGYWLVAR